MICRNRPTALPRWLRGTFRLVAMCMLVAGFVYCTDESELTSVDPALTLAAGDLQGDRAAGREILSTWLDNLRNLEVTGPELDTPWTRDVSAGIQVHFDSVVAEGPAGPNAMALQATFMQVSLTGPRLSVGSPQRFMMLNRVGESRQSETVIVDLSRLSDASAGTGVPLSLGVLEAVIRRSASLRGGLALQRRVRLLRHEPGAGRFAARNCVIGVAPPPGSADLRLAPGCGI